MLHCTKFLTVYSFIHFTIGTDVEVTCLNVRSKTTKIYLDCLVKLDDLYLIVSCSNYLVNMLHSEKFLEVNFSIHFTIGSNIEVTFSKLRLKTTQIYFM